jgi:hypothetical protein
MLALSGYGIMQLAPRAYAGMLNMAHHGMLPRTAVRALAPLSQLDALVANAAVLPAELSLNTSKNLMAEPAPRRFAFSDGHVLRYASDDAWGKFVQGLFPKLPGADFQLDEYSSLDMDMGTYPTNTKLGPDNSLSGTKFAPSAALGLVALDKPVTVRAHTTGPFVIDVVAAQSGVYKWVTQEVDGLLVQLPEHVDDVMGTRNSDGSWSISLSPRQPFAIGVFPVEPGPAFTDDGTYTGELIVESATTRLVGKLSITLSSKGLFTLAGHPSIIEIVADKPGVCALKYYNKGEPSHLVIPEQTNNGIHIPPQSLPVGPQPATLQIVIEATPATQTDVVLPVGFSYSVYEGKQAGTFGFKVKVTKPSYVNAWSGDLRDKVSCQMQSLITESGFIDFSVHIYDSSLISGDQGNVAYVVVDSQTKPEFADSYAATFYTTFETGSAVAGAPRNWNTAWQQVYPKVAANYIDCIDHGGVLFSASASTDWGQAIGTAVEHYVDWGWGEAFGYKPSDVNKH